MSSEKNAEALFKKYKNKYVTKLGRHALSTDEIDMLMKTKPGQIRSPYRGCYAQDETFPIKSGRYIINTDLATIPGIHWIAMYITDTTAYFYDSFGRPAKELVPILLKRLKKRKVIDSDLSDKKQKDVEVICGHLSVAWCQVVNNIGIRNAIKI